MFLSYASQDAEAAKRICDALRAAGVEVWFDQSELVGGDSWDAKIRGQIGSCALFMPVISANTQARLEGYFRIEWKIAARRTHAMATAKAFLLPVVIDDTHDAGAHVPDEFRDVQWTRLKGGETPPAFGERVKKLLSQEPFAAAQGRQGAGSTQQEIGADSGHGTQNPEPRTKTLRLGRFWWALPIFGVTMALVLVLKEARTELAPLSSPPAGKPSVPQTEAQELTRKARALIDDDLMAVRENFRLADEFSRHAVALDATDGEAWATAARVSALILRAKYEMTPERKETAKTQVERAGRLAPDSIETGLALATYLEVNNDPGEAERLLRRLVQRAPTDKRLWRSLAANLANNDRNEEALATLRQPAGLLEEDPQAQSLLANVLSNLGRYREEEAVLDRVLRRSPTKLAYYYQLVLEGFFRSDLAAASRILEKIPPQLMQEDSMINSAAEIWLRLGEGDKALQVLQKSPRDFLEEGFEVRPKGFLTGAALQLLGRPTAATAEWRQALVVVENRLAGNPNQPLLLYWRGVLQALTRQKAAALETRKLYRELEAKPNAWFDAILLVAAGENEQAIQGLERAWPTAPVSRRVEIRGELLYGPWLTAIRADPRMQRLISEQTAVIEHDRAGPTAAPAKADEKSVAVLAFANLSDDKANEYFSDGISEELLTVLLKVPGLKVSARTSSFSFKGREITVQEVGRILGVAYVIEGSVRKAGGQVRVTGRLSRTDTGQQLWSENYTRALADVFALQTELAQTIVGQLRGQLTGEPAAGSPDVAGQITAAQRGGTTKVAAHELYLQGAFFTHQPSIDNLAKAEDYFQRAVDLDPDYALAWASLGRTTALRAEYEEASAEAMRAKFARARRATDRALALAPNLPEAYFARFEIQTAYDFDWRAARDSLEQALRLSPADAMLISNASQQAAIFGDLEKSLQLGRQAAELDPVNAEVRYWLSRTLASLGRLAESEAELRRAMEFSPSLLSAHRQLSTVLVLQGRFDDAVKEARLEKSEWSRSAALSVACWAARDRPAADAALARLIEVGSELSAYQLAETCAFRGEMNRAFDWLEKAYRNRDSGLGALRSDPLLRELHGDPRWPAFLKKVGLADDQLK